MTQLQVSESTEGTDTTRRPERHKLIDYANFQTITMRWMDNDMYGHVNNTVYYSYFDTAVNSLLIENGVLDAANGNVIGLVVQTGCSYAEALSFPGEVSAGIRVARLGTSSVKYEIGLFRSGDYRAAAQGFFIHVYVDRETQRPVPLPVKLRKFLETLIADHNP